MSFPHPLRAARFAALCMIAPLVVLAAPHEARAQTASQSPSTAYTSGASCTPNGALSYNGNSFISCASGAWAVQPVITGLIYPTADSTTAIQFDKANGTSNVVDIDTTNGRVGIGTTSPAAKLQVRGGALFMDNYQEISFANASGTNDYWQIYSDSASGIYGGSASAFVIYGNGVTRMAISTAGNVGIGTAPPSAGNTKLDLNGNLQFSNGYGLVFTKSDGTVPYWQLFNDNGSGTYTGSADSLAIQQGSTPVTRLLINTSGNIALNPTSGNVGIGTTSPSYLLHVGSASASGAVVAFQNSTSLCSVTPASSAATFSCSSDVRLKTDIDDAGSGLAWLEGLRVRDFTMKATGERQTGVIAQELADIHPDMVRMGSNGFYTVDTPNPWLLVKAIQELKADNDDLRARVVALEAKADQ